MTTSAQKRAMAKWHKDNMDHVNLWVRKGGYERWKEYARLSGVSFRRFVIDAVEEKAAREGVSARIETAPGDEGPDEDEGVRQHLPECLK